MRVDVVWSRRGGSCRTVFFLGAVVVISPLISCGHAVGLFLIVYSLHLDSIEVHPIEVHPALFFPFALFFFLFSRRVSFYFRAGFLFLFLVIIFLFSQFFSAKTK